MSENSTAFGKVVKVLDNRKLAINRGARDGVKLGHRFLVYELTEEIRDVDTNELLGSLEIAKGTGIVTNVQEKLSLIESDTREKKPRFVVNALAAAVHPPDLFDSIVAFDGPEIGDLVKPV